MVCLHVNDLAFFFLREKMQRQCYTICVYFIYLFIAYITVWADHADAISKQYAGTGALKTDVTRTGKRTIQGMINDGVNSLIRYWKNNFRDGFKQVTTTDKVGGGEASVYFL